MSLIEKAVSKLGESPVVETPQQADPIVTHIPAAAESHGIPPQAEVRSEGEQLAWQGSGKELSRTGSMNVEKMRRAGMVTPDGERTQISEEFRLVKRPLLSNAFRRDGKAIKRGNMIMVTSALPGEGKTFTAINLATSIALERDQTVLLVDADVAKASIPEFLGIPYEKGLLDVLADEAIPLSDVMIRTQIDNFSILPAGRRHRNSTELLASEAMHKLVEELATRYPDRIIIFDSPPLLATSEASVLAEHMGQIVMVIETGKTPQEALREALGLVERCEFVGVVMNKGSSAARDGYGYYGTYGNQPS